MSDVETEGEPEEPTPDEDVHEDVDNPMVDNGEVEYVSEPSADNPVSSEDAEDPRPADQAEGDGEPGPVEGPTEDD